MVSSTDVLFLVQTMNSLMSLSREFHMGYSELAAIIERADREGREVQVSDLDPLRDSAMSSRQDLVDAINEAREKS